ncbi:hypothetical protein EVAR_19854_1 [Eumeta japonica]|uniref:Uncharacterized protein n=1 Tax=Eumeta variegata TaxID=151549 RepID=A0A4C1UR69_EUMVA|nr:hypothetical protein EVAR_19854_1 [Eumeta japonica]
MHPECRQPSNGKPLADDGTQHTPRPSPPPGHAPRVRKQCPSSAGRPPFKVAFGKVTMFETDLVLDTLVQNPSINSSTGPLDRRRPSRGMNTVSGTLEVTSR